MKKVYINENFIPMLIMEAMTIDDIWKKYYQDVPEPTYLAAVKVSDPTWNPQQPNKMGKYGKWILGLYRKGNWKPTDYKETKDCLTIFDKYKGRLNIKDITQITSINALYSLVSPYMDNTQAATKSEQQRRIKEGAEKVYEDEYWLVVIPHTKEASILYGKHTRWCTAADESNNMFDYYNKRGKLYINIDKKNNHKYQFHFESNSFMDEEDEEIEKPVFETMGASKGLIDFYKNNVEPLDYLSLNSDYLPDRRYQNYSDGVSAFLVWDERENHCKFINADGKDLSPWFNDGEPFKTPPSREHDPWGIGATTWVSINAYPSFFGTSVYQDPIELSADVYMGDGQIRLGEWKDGDGKVYFDVSYDCDGDEPIWIYNEEEYEDYDSRYDVDELRRNLKRIIKESNEPLTFYKFFNEVKKFISDLLKDPLHARPSDLLKSKGLDNDKLRTKLQDENVVVKKETIKEPRNETNGKVESRYYVSYKVPRKDFKKKLRRMYQKIFEK